MTEPSPAYDLYVEGQRAADLELWLHQRKDAPHEATVTYRAPDSQAASNLGAEPSPEVTIYPTDLLSLSSSVDDYGRALTAMLFADERLRAAFIQARNLARGAQAPLRVRLRLDSDDPLLHSVRWETLRDPTQERDLDALCAQAETRFSRFFASPDATAIMLPTRATLTALVGIAAPSNAADFRLAPIDPARERELILPALDGIATRVLEHTTLPALIQALQDRVDILYLIAHGGIDLNDNVPYLYLEDEQGRVSPITGDLLVEALSGLAHRPLLVVLASCQSAGTSHGYGEARIALGPRIAEKGIGAVIAMHDDFALATAQAGLPVLFKQFRTHGCIDLAMVEMRAVLKARGSDWWQPVLYLRLADGRLWCRPPVGAPTSGSFIRITELGPQAQETVWLKSYDNLSTIGRKTGSDLQFPIDEPRVSWDHGQIIRQRGAYYYRHLSGSSETTLTRRGGREAFLFKPGSNEEQELKNQDRLMIGNHTFVISHTLVDEYKGYISTDGTTVPEPASKGEMTGAIITGGDRS